MADTPPVDTTSPGVKEAPAENLTAEQTEAKERSVQGSTSGIGAKLRQASGMIVVEHALAGGPAERQGLADGTAILAINGVTTAGMRIPDAVKLIAGPEGTTVALKVRAPDGRERTIELVREKIVLGRPRYQMIGSRIGLVQLTAFNQQTPAAVRQAVSALESEGATGLILDLRGTPGGSLPAVAAIADLFLRRGRPMWIYEDMEGNRQVKKAATKQQFSLPMVVVIDGQTRAGELLAAALQRNERAVLVGHHTSGASLNRELVKNADGSSRLVVRGTFLQTPRDPISGVGVQPDVKVAEDAAPDHMLRAAEAELRKLLPDNP